MSSALQATDVLAASVSQAIGRTVDWLLARQNEKGYWWGDLTADATLEADYLLLQLWLYPPKDGQWQPPTRSRIDRAVRSIRERQLPDGGFAVYPGGPADVSASVKAYFAMKLSGMDPNGAELSILRSRIHALGGLQAANSYVKINLSLFNLYPREQAPSIPPEIILMGDVIYRMSAWSRTILIPLAIVHALNAAGRPVPSGFSLEELFTPGNPETPAVQTKLFSWKQAFLLLDKGLKLWERYGSQALRRRAIERCKEWVLERIRYTDGLGAIYPPMMYTVMALDLLGYPPGNPNRDEAEQQFYNLIVEDGERFFFQPCFSVVWDTAIASHALGESGIASDQVMERAVDWLLSKEVRRKGDWSIRRPDVEPSGWYFEFANEFYPDIDDTGMVLIALAQSKGSDAAVHRATIQRAVNWVLAMQSKDGGWAAFDVDNTAEVLSHVPFADHNAMLDPTCADITGRVIEGLLAHGVPSEHPAIRRGVQYLIRAQEADGSWFGRWGVNYIYGTYLAVRGLSAAGESDREVHILRAAEWLRAIQNADGGWGESCESYAHGAYVNGPSTPSQTAWAILGLIACGDLRSESAQRGVEYLLATQKTGGDWDETQATGTGFPRVFYLMYHLYRNSFPLLALSTFLKARKAER